MFHAFNSSRLAWLGIGIGIGLLATLMAVGLWPETPVHAVATDRYETFAMATGPVDEEFEAVYFLDFLTGDLRATVLGKMGNAFTAFYTYNVSTDFGVERGKGRFMMVTGLANRVRGTGAFQPSAAVVYVAEITSGQVAAYGIPWAKTQHSRGGVMQPMALVPLAMTRFRAAGGGAPGP